MGSVGHELVELHLVADSSWDCTMEKFQQLLNNAPSCAALYLHDWGGDFVLTTTSVMWMLMHISHPTEGGQVEVQQESLIQVAFANEQVLMTCLVSFPRTTHYSSFIGSCYLLNSKGQRTTIKTCSISVPIPAGQENQTAKESYRCDIEPYKAASGTYYCEANWTSLTQKGHGTFVLVRGKLPSQPRKNQKRKSEWLKSDWNFP